MVPERKSRQRQRLRDQGLRPLEIWLPKPMIESIDAMKSEGEGRDMVIAKLLAGTLEGRTPPEPTSQLSLGL